jgi:hypothetical protein
LISRATAHPLPWKLCAAALLLLLGLVLCSRISHPWTYNDDYNGAFWSQAARNLSQAGFFSTAGVPAPLYFGAPPIPADALYVHHPTLLAAMMLLDRAILGESESAARCLPILFSLLSAALLCWFVSICRGWRCAAFVLGFFVAAPMELHYGQMVNFEAPELFFQLATLCCFHLWRWRRTSAGAIGLLFCCLLAIATDWQGYLLAMLLAGHLLIKGPDRNPAMAAALLLAACFSGLLFLAQIRLASPGAWQELLHAFRERSGQGNLSGGSFTIRQWLLTEYDDLTTLFHPVAWALAAAGAALAIFSRRRLSVREAAPLQIGATLFFIDAFYVCALRNQSYIHDFACFYFLVPVAIFSGFLVEQTLLSLENLLPDKAALAATLACSLLAAALIWSGIRRLDGIDTQFCILDDDNTEPPDLMPDLGRLIDQTFPSNAVVICNFDPYYSPLPYYARRVMVNDLHTYADWQAASADARPQPAGGILWADAPEAAALQRHLPPSQTRRVMVDGIPFILWTPQPKDDRDENDARRMAPNLSGND